MDETVKKQWIEALRSGKYEQGTAYLRKNDRHCCLGVLCDISGLGEWKEDGLLGGDAYVTNSYATSKALPPAVMEWAGLLTANPYIGKVLQHGRVGSLAEYNDGIWVEKKDFNGIADLIEEYL